MKRTSQFTAEKPTKRVLCFQTRLAFIGYACLFFPLTPTGHGCFFGVFFLTSVRLTGGRTVCSPAGRSGQSVVALSLNMSQRTCLLHTSCADRQSLREKTRHSGNYLMLGNVLAGKNSREKQR